MEVVWLLVVGQKRGDGGVMRGVGAGELRDGGSVGCGDAVLGPHLCPHRDITAGLKGGDEG